jgi:polygalacturonase
MKKYIVCCFVLLAASGLRAGNCYNVKDFGAVGDGIALDTRALQKAFDQCSEHGGTVIVPAGVYVTGVLALHSNMELRLEAGAVIKGSADLKDYAFDGRRVGMFYSANIHDVTICGQGVIDGNGNSFCFPGRAKQMDEYGYRFTRQKELFRHVDQGLGDGPVVPFDKRPYQMIIFSNCKDITVKDITLRDSPFWTLHFADCESVNVHHLRIDNNLMVPNNDGIDFTDCSYVTVSDCDIRCGDDALVFTGYSYHHDLPGFQELKKVSRNITVSNCTLVSRSSGIRIGGADQNAMRNYLFSNITITDSNRGVGIFLREDGSIENMLFENMVIETRYHTGDWWGNGEPIHISAVRGKPDFVRGKRNFELGRVKNISFNHIVARSEAGILLYGIPESVIRNVSFNDLHLTITRSPLVANCGGNFDLRPAEDHQLELFAHDIPAIYGQYVSNITLRDVSVDWDKTVNASFATYALQMEHYTNLFIDHFEGSPAPSAPLLPAVYLTNGTETRLNNINGKIFKSTVK